LLRSFIIKKIYLTLQTYYYLLPRDTGTHLRRMGHGRCGGRPTGAEGLPGLGERTSSPVFPGAEGE